MLKKAVLIGLMTTLCFGLAGCGVKGDLYLPHYTATAAR